MALGGGFIYCAVRLLRSADRRWALRTYLFSLAYLALLFVSMPLDRRSLVEIRARGPRDSEERNMTAGLVAGGIAAGVFALTFVVAVLYIAS